jgi:uncharacterized membrane protein
MTAESKNFQNLAIAVLVLAVLTLLAYVVAPLARPVEQSGLVGGGAAVGQRFLIFALGAALALGLAYATRDNPIWDFGVQTPVYMVVGAILSGVLTWMTNGQTIPIPALSQVGLAPGLAVAVFFGFLYGPAAGLMAGAGGQLIGDLFIGNVAPHWIMGYGLAGMAAGLGGLFEDQRQSWDVAAIIAGLGGLLSAVVFLANPSASLELPPDFKPAPLSLLMGLSVLAGSGLAIAVRFAFPNRPEWGRAAVWGAAGAVVGLLLAALSEIWLSGATLTQAFLGRFVPAAGPAILLMAILTPLALGLRAAAEAAEQ